MFKSVFTKYIVSFALLIALSFMLLVLTVSSMLTNYSIQSKKSLMAKTADGIAIVIDAYAAQSKNSVFEETIKTFSPHICADLVGFSGLSDTIIYVVSQEGVLLAGSDSAKKYGDQIISESLASAIILDPTKYALSSLDGTFDGNRLNCFKTIKQNDDTVGIIMISSLTAQDKSLSGAMIQTILTASIWIFLAALVTVYIISQRIIDPLKKLSSAAKSFAMGNFKERVYVSGHDEVAELAAAFNNMASVLEKNEELRNSFLGNVSHDLRTPMTVISGFVDGIRDGTIPTEKQDYYLEIISTEVRRLSRLVSTLLEISKMQSGDRKLTITRFNLSEKTRQILLSFEKKIDDKKIEIEFNNDSDIFVSADTDAIHQVLYNLTDNAVKFTPQGGTLSIT
ncbi:MAG: HAMP domain-containing sensor histidine kinase, partial [Clostridia bacterium]